MIRIFTDTTASLTLEEYQKYQIEPVALYVNQGELSQRELFEMPYEEFYRLQRAGSKFTTSQPSPEDFLKAFRPAIEAGDEIVCILLSSKISGSVNSAVLAGNMLETDQISVVDSKMSGFGQASLAIRAKEMADRGASRAEIVTALEDQQSRTRTYFIVNSLRYLHEGGRLSGIEALVGSIIQIKPIVWFTSDGTMTSFEKVRTLNTAKARLLELVKEQAGAGIEKIGLHYGDNIEEATEYGKSLEEVTGIPVQLIKISPVISTHTGPDVLGPCFIGKR